MTVSQFPLPRNSDSLADGQVATSWAAIYTVPASTKVKIDKLIFHNAGSVSENLDVAITRSGGTRRKIRRPVLAAEESAELENLVLSEGDAIEAQTTTAAAVDYVVMGATE